MAATAADDTTAAAFALAKKGDLQAVINSIASSPALVRATDVNGWTLLHVFARLSLAPAVKQLLMLGAAPEARDATFRSALHLAARADALVPGAPRDGDARSADVVDTLTALLSTVPGSIDAELIRRLPPPCALCAFKISCHS